MAPSFLQHPFRGSLTRVVAPFVAAATMLGLVACDGGDDLPAPSASADAPTSSPVDDGATSAPGVVEGDHLDNPFEGARMYVNDAWAENVIETADRVEDTSIASKMRDVARQPTAVWLDSIGAIAGEGDAPGLRHHLDAAVAQAESSGDPTALTLVVYDLPGRDCSAAASTGELAATQEGLASYRHDYIDPIASMVAEEKYRDLRIVALIEPDSLANIVTNGDIAACAEADPLYRDGVAYALDTFARLAHVYSYLDAAHAGWLGWDDNASAAAALFAEVAESTEAGLDAVDGFVTNVSNYTPLEEPYLTDPDLLVGEEPVSAATFYGGNAAFDEADWTASLYDLLVDEGFPESTGMLIDTSRNGWGGSSRPVAAASSDSVDALVEASKVDRRWHRSAWCNQKGAGLGRLPQALPAGFPGSHLDALIWAKPPGESDGASSAASGDGDVALDPMCDPQHTSEQLGGRPTNAMGDAPAAGEWFAQQLSDLVANAYPAIGSPQPSPRDPDEDEEAEAPDATADPEAGVGSCSATLDLRDVWSTGFVADVTVTANTPVSGWTVAVSLPDGTRIVDQWTGEFSATSGSLSVSDAGWNGPLEAGSSATFGFTGRGDAPAPGALACTAR
ncbi:glycoside hydrolase family 6 protein [Demequina sp. NBRC 110055]|uniref:glycoside hydrolase family 6 protein n=1 Tax=Demequina sp. NBRC 110055 TaxID=1570344 RepID=UPI001F370DBC|nr:glycoside hydrolase family 6 protein [Demequina sp. NBRC 110055]